MAPRSPVPAFLASTEASRRYDLGEVIAAGGMGTVYRAHDKLGQRMVAYKRMSPPAAAQHARYGALFQREFDTLAQLAHPHIVEVYDYGFDPHGPYYTMELLAADSLSKLTPLPFAEAARLLRELASALALLHARGLVHRDLSPRNVCLTQDRRAKLIDFGALCAFGRPKEVVGTAPFVAPECLQGATLDARTDLYALGALAYFLITGQTHVDARRFEDLPEAWRARPLPPSQLASGVSEACDELLLSLLELSPSARPASAAYVMERLTSMASLGPEHEPERVALSYLRRPVLIGREQPLGELRRALGLARAGRGQVCLIEAEQGLGQSALLEQVAVEAQMAGAIVLRAAPELHGSPFSAARDLVRQGLSLLPSVGDRLRGRNSLFARLSQAKSAEEPALHSAIDASERTALISGLLQEGMEALAEEAPVVLLLDGAHGIDAESVAWLAALADTLDERAIMLVLGHRKHEAWRDANALARLQIRARRSELTPLDAEQLHELVVRTLGEVPNSASFSAWLFAETGGNPEHCVNLARLLVQTGAVRYALGTFTLPYQPVQTAAGDRQRALLHRLARVSVEAQQLAALLCLHRGALSAGELVRAQGAESSRVVAALRELAQHAAVVMSQDRYACASEALRAAIHTTLDAAQRRALHLALARALERQGAERLDDVCRVAEHLLEAGDAEQLEGAIMLARAADQHSFELGMQPARVQVLERALVVLGAHGYDDRACVPLLVPLSLAGFFGDFTTLGRYLERTLEALYALAGLTRARTLRRFLGARIALWVGLVSAFVAHGLSRRRLCRRSFVELIEHLVGVTGTSTAALACAFDVQGARAALRGLEPLAVAPVKSPLFFMREFCVATAELVAAQLESASRRYSALLRIYEKPVFGITDKHRVQVRSGCLNGLAQAVASDGLPRALELADRLEHEGGGPFYAPHAESVRAAYYAYRGELPRAHRHRDRAEALALRAGNCWSAMSVFSVRLMTACAQSGDVIGLRRVVADLEQLSRQAPSLRVVHQLGEAHLASLRGQSSDALARYARAFEDPRTRSLPTYAAERALHVRALSAHGDHAQAREVGLTTLRELEQSGTAAQNPLLYCLPRMALAIAEAELGDTAQAAQRLDACLGRDLGPENPFLLGSLHRDRAYVAALAGDAPRFEHHFHATTRLFEVTDNPPLLAQCTRLEADAVRLGVRNPPSSELRLSSLDGDTSVERPGASDTDGVDQETCDQTALQLPATRG